MSNNSAILETDSDFEQLGLIAERVVRNGEPGIINKINMQKGRIGHNEWCKKDLAIGENPCGEIPLEDKELCCLAETLPTVCNSPEDWLKACEYATVYASTVTLLPTHQQSTNKVICRNRRIGVGIIDVSGWKYAIGVNQMVKWLRRGYAKVKATNKWVNSEAGVPEAIRCTTIKPGGTTPKLAGKTSGIGHPTFIYTLRRVRVASNSSLCNILTEAGYYGEPDVLEPKVTMVYEFPIKQGPAKPATEVSLWEQALNLVLMQREWSDNAVSNTLYFNKSEEKDIEAVLSAIAPFTKSVSLLPHSDIGAYPQMPEEGITESQYLSMLANIKPIDWSKYREVAEPEKYCEGEKCQVAY